MKIYFIVGEDSGDLHAANLMRELKIQQPGIQFRGIGGDKMISQGSSIIAHVRDTNFMGFKEVLSNIQTIRRLFKQVKEDIRDWKPDKIVLVDYPGFNLRMASFAKGLNIPVIYYISPQIWAWKKGRIKKIKRDVDTMMVILPFEKEFYQNEGMEVKFVGHPLLDVIPEPSKEQKNKKLVALLPGSRKQEIRRILPILSSLPAMMPDFEFVVAGAPSQTPLYYEQFIDAKELTLEMDNTYDLLQRASFAVVASGTATLETALFQVPQVVVYQASQSFYRIMKRIIKIPYISLVNLIMDKEVVKELVQENFTPEKVVKALNKLNTEEGNLQLMEAYKELRELLGQEGASKRAATIVLRKEQ